LNALALAGLVDHGGVADTTKLERVAAVALIREFQIYH
jgi:hypothetical protein